MNDDLFTAAYASPLGPMLMAASARGLAGLWFEGEKHWPAQAHQWAPRPQLAVFSQAARQLDGYFAGRLRAFELPLDLSRGTAFQQRVWQALLSIPFGQTVTYGTLATALASPQAMRAVGAASGRNPVSIVVPCHRVLGADGTLTGYAGGLARKRALLLLEAPSADATLAPCP